MATSPMGCSNPAFVTVPTPMPPFKWLVCLYFQRLRIQVRRL